MGGYATVAGVLLEGLLTFVGVPLVEEISVMVLDDVEPRLSSSEAGVMWACSSERIISMLALDQSSIVDKAVDQASTPVMEGWST